MPPFVQLQLENFKNYRVRTTFQWMQVSAILGLNGAGKSTIVDAVEFVLCFPRYTKKSVATLRKELYHKDSEENEHSSSWVSATIIIDNVEREFKRSVNYKKSAHEYRIDNEVVDLSAYKALLLKVNVNSQANNFLVRQNSIESLSLQNAKQRREFFEVLSSSIINKSEYDRLAGEMKSMESEVTALQNTITLHNKEKSGLMQKNKGIKAYDKVKRQFEEDERDYFLMKLYGCLTTIDRLEKEKKTNEDHKKVCKQLIDEYRKNVRKLKNEYAEKESALIAIEQELESNDSEYSAYKQQGTELNENISLMSKQIENVQKNLQKAKSIHEAHLKTLADLRNQLNEIKYQLSLDESESVSLDLNEDQYEKYLQLKAKAQEEFLKKNTNFSSLKREYDNIKDQIDAKNNEKKVLSTQIEKESSLLKRIRDQKDNVDRKLAQTLRDIEGIKAEDKKLVEEIKQLQIDCENAISSIQKLNEDLINFDAQCQESRRQRRKNEIMSLLRAKCPGVIGRLVDICRIDERYGIAITKILGSKMDAIIVDTVATGRKCIETLKDYYENDEHPAIETFYPLEKLKTKTLPKELLGIIEEDPNAKLAMDVINVRQVNVASKSFNVKQVYMALRSFIGDVVILETDDQANEFSRDYSVNCVALDGTYYRKDGTFSGGSSDMRKQAKQWNAKEYEEKAEERRKMTEGLINSQLKMKEKQDSRKDLEGKLSGLEHRLKEYLNPAKKECDEKLKAKEVELETLKKTLEVYETDSNLGELLESLSDKKRQIDKLKEEENNIEDEVFSSFCERYSLKNIRQYKENDLRKHEEQAKQRIELDNLKAKIENQIHFEEKRKTEGTVKQYKDKLHKLKEEQQKLLRKKEQWEKKRSENDQSSELKAKIKTMRRDMASVENNLAEQERILLLAKKDLKSYENIIALHTSEVDRLRLTIHQILTECKMKNINIPLETGSIQDVVLESKIVGVESESSDTQSESSGSGILEKDVKYDFSELSESIKQLNASEFKKELESKKKLLKELEDKLESCIPSNRNLKRELESLATKIKDDKKELDAKLEKFNDLKSTFDDIKNHRKKLFSEFFNSVEEEIDVIIKSLYNNSAAQAHLVATNPDEPYLGEITLSCLVPNKKFCKIENLSGGEKTMCAMALFLAVFNAKPAPCIIFDEMDAALDNFNLENIVNIFMKWKASTQIIIISHKERLFRCADAAVGVNISTRQNSSYAVHVDLSPYVQIVNFPRLPLLESTPNRSLEDYSREQQSSSSGNAPRLPPLESTSSTSLRSSRSVYAPRLPPLESTSSTSLRSSRSVNAPRLPPLDSTSSPSVQSRRSVNAPRLTPLESTSSTSVQDHSSEQPSSKSVNTTRSRRKSRKSSRSETSSS